MADRICSVPNCEGVNAARSYCSMHLQRFYATGGVGPSGPFKKKLGRNSDGTVKNCVISTCKKKQHAKRLCNRHNHMHTTFNMPLGMIEKFEGNPECSIPSCKSTEMLRIDHDHSCCDGPRSCGRCVRGWLCHKCNSALGFVRDNPEILKDLGTYLGEGFWWKK